MVPSVTGHRLGGPVRASIRGDTYSNKIHGKCFTLVAWGPCVLCGHWYRARGSLDEFSKWRTMAFVVDMDQLIIPLPSLYPLLSSSLACVFRFTSGTVTFSLLCRFLSSFNPCWRIAPRFRVSEQRGMLLWKEASMNPHSFLIRVRESKYTTVDTRPCGGD